MKGGLRIAIRGLVAVVLAACLLAGYFAVRPAHDAPAGVVRLPRVSAAASAGAEAVRRMAVNSFGVPASQAASGVRVRAADEVEVCGLGWVKKTEGSPDGLRALLDASDPEAMVRWLDVLARSPDERLRATALRTRAMMTPDEHESAQWTDRFVRMAVTTKDPAVYAMVIQACRSFGGKSAVEACQLISEAQWARLDADNAIPWLFVADRAKSRGDLAAHAEALHRASMASTVRNDFLVPTAALMNADRTGVSLPEAVALSTVVMGVQAAWTFPGDSLRTSCSVEAVSDSNRRQTCSRLADLLTAHPASLVELSMGLSIGRRLGWSADKVERLRSRARALSSWSIKQSVGAGEGTLSCAAVERLRRFITAAAMQGETEALIEEITASGISLEDLVDQQVKSDQAIARKIALDLANANAKELASEKPER